MSKDKKKSKAKAEAKQAKNKSNADILQATMSGYANSNASKTKRTLIAWKSSSNTADEDITEHLPTLRERSRDLYVSGGISSGALNKIVTNVVGSGLQLNSQIDHEYLGITREQASKIERQIEREFNLWANDKYNCDIAASCNFYEMQALAFLSMLMSGDCFILLPILKRAGNIYQLKMQLVESDRVTDPDFIDLEADILQGIECDQYGAAIAYYIKQRMKPNAVQQKYQKVDAYTKSGRPNILHLRTMERPEQRRSIPLLSNIIEQVKQLSRYNTAELDAAVLSAMFTVFIKKAGDEEDEGAAGQYKGELAEPESEEQSLAPGNMRLSPGGIVELEEGEDISIANPGRPNQQFDAFTTAIIRQIGMAIEVPYEVLVQHFQSSYSASRAAILQAWQMFKKRRKWLVDNFCLPIYKEWMTEAVLMGRLKLSGFFNDPLAQQAWLGANFYGASMPEIDPEKAVRASTLRINEALSTRERESMELTGLNFDEIVSKRVDEETQMNKVREISNKTDVSYGKQVNNNGGDNAQKN